MWTLVSGIERPTTIHIHDWHDQPPFIHNQHDQRSTRIQRTFQSKHESKTEHRQSHQKKEKNPHNQKPKEILWKYGPNVFTAPEPAFRIENREKKSREIDRRSSCTSECLSSLVSSTRKSLWNFASTKLWLDAQNSRSTQQRVALSKKQVENSKRRLGIFTLSTNFKT